KADVLTRGYSHCLNHRGTEKKSLNHRPYFFPLSVSLCLCGLYSSAAWYLISQFRGNLSRNYLNHRGTEAQRKKTRESLALFVSSLCLCASVVYTLQRPGTSCEIGRWILAIVFSSPRNFQKLWMAG